MDNEMNLADEMLNNYRAVLNGEQMTELEEKAVMFSSALAGCYKNHGGPLDIETDFTTDVTAMLMAMFAVVSENSTFDSEYDDPIGFTHLLNRLAIQHVFGDKEDNREH